MRGALLELVTLGFYRFWLATDIRRHLWSHTSVDGDAPEYTGTAKELLIGFLFAMAILVPIYLVYFLLGIEAERLQAFASVPLILFFYLFAQFAIYRARRYRLTRTVWRGVRFWMRGRAGTTPGAPACGRCCDPHARARVAVAAGRARTLQDAHSSTAICRADSTAPAGELFKQVWWMWLGDACCSLVACRSRVHRDSVHAPRLAGHARHRCIIAVAAVPLAVYKAIEWRWWVSGIRFGKVRFESELTRVRLIGLYWKVIGWSVLVIWSCAWIGASSAPLTSSRGRCGGTGTGRVRNARRSAACRPGRDRGRLSHLRARFRRGRADLSAPRLWARVVASTASTIWRRPTMWSRTARPGRSAKALPTVSMSAVSSNRRPIRSEQRTT